MSKKTSREDAIRQLWELGNLDYKLKGKQKVIKDTLIEDKDDISIVLCSRRFGKSYILCCMAVEQCIRKPDSVVKYVCPKQNMVRQITKQVMKPVLEDCPPHLTPEWKPSEKIYIFPNGSEIQIAGSDNGNADNIRGGHADLCIVDEAGFVNELDYVIKSVLAPTVDTTGGRIIMASTPNYKDPTHEFNVEYILQREREGTLIKFTVYDSPMVDEAKIQKIIQRYPGGVTNAKFRCEYLCEVCVDPAEMVIPEFTGELQKEIIGEWDRPSRFDAYVAADVAFVDLTVVLFGYYDFMKATLVIEEELVMNGSSLTTDKLADNIRDIEYRVFQDEISGEPIKPFLRVIDNNNLILVNDLNVQHGITFIPTAKDNKEAAINNVRILMQQKRIVISPRCKHLIYQLRSAKWKTTNKKAREFERIKDSPLGIKGGHADAVDALIYMVRNLVQSKNPYPAGHFDLKGSNVFRSANSLSKVDEKKDSIMRKIMNIKD